jgi:hypothetical protein
VYTLWVARRSVYAERNDNIGEYRDLFSGEHWKEQLSEEEQISEDTFQLVVNYCRSTVLHFVGALAASPRFRVPRPVGDIGSRLRAELRERWLAGLRDSLLRAWTDVEMDASKTRFGVLQVLWDPKATKKGDVFVGSPFIFRSIDPALFYPCYRTYNDSDDFFYVIREEPNRLIEDLEERYKVKLQAVEMEQGTEGACTVLEYWDKDHYYFVALTHVDVTDSEGNVSQEDVYTILEEGKHGYPRIPFFVLQNIRNAHEDPTHEGSLGDVDAISDLNKHLDWLYSEHGEEILLQIHRPLVYKSPDHMKKPNELRATPGAVFDIGEDEEIDPLVWPPEPEMVQHHFRMTRSAIDDMSFIPKTAQGDIPAGASGVGMGVANTPLQRILELKKPRRIETLKAIAAFLLRVAEGKSAPIAIWCAVSGNQRTEVKIDKEEIAGDYYVDVAWRNMMPRDEVAYEAHQAYLFKTGVQTLAQTLDKLGVEWVESELQQLQEEYIDPKINPERAMQYVQAMQALKQLEEPAAEDAQGTAGAQMPQLQAPSTGATAQGGPAAVQVPGIQQGGVPPARGQLPIQPPVPSFMQGGMAGRLTPFGPREQFGAGALPLRPQGPGISPPGRGRGRPPEEVS